MKYIEKGQEPAEFTQWKEEWEKLWKPLRPDDWQPEWNNDFQNPEKGVVYNALLKEQGYICCYCERRIDKPTSHIEHFKPRKTYPQLAFVYDNLLCSCNGRPEGQNKGPQDHCGQEKSEWFDENLLISPLDKDCADYFQYTGAGEILPSKVHGKEEAAKETIKHCKLNHERLRTCSKSFICVKIKK